MHICTIIAKNYLAQARVLAESFLAHHPDGTCDVLVVDDVEATVDDAAEPFTLVTPAELNIELFEQMVGSYTVLELSTAVKPWLLSTLQSRYTDGRVVYLDPDIEVHNSLQDVDDLIAAHGLVLTPHTTDPMPRDGKRPSEGDILIAGAYNLGFIGAARTEPVARFLEWWSERLSRDCIVDPARGYFVDQRWIDFVPGMMPDVHLLRDPGYNVAYWNLPTRRLSEVDGRVEVNGRPLRFFHYSGFDPGRAHRLSKYQDRISLAEDPVLARLCANYARALDAHGFAAASGQPYGYSRLPGGIAFSPFLRRLHGQALEAGALTASVFTPEGGERFLTWLGETADPGANGGLNRFLFELWNEREDLQQAYPDLDWHDVEGFAGWTHVHGSHEVPIPARLLPSKPAMLREGRERERQAALPGPGPGVNVAGYFRSELGIGEAARRLMQGLDARDVPCLPVHPATLPVHRQGHDYGIAELSSALFDVNVVCVNADGLPAFAEEAGPAFFADRYTIGLWFWEVEAFPERFASAFELVNEVWVASHHMAEAIGAQAPAGVPVVKVTLPVTPPPVSRVSRAELALPEGHLFLFMFDHLSVFARKNPLATVAAFRAAFAPGEGPALVIKTINAEHDPEGREALRVAAAGHPDVHLLEGFVDPSRRDALLAACDTYVSLHRSEGLGLTVAEAMALGKPVICTDYSGTQEYANAQNAYLVPFALVPVGPGAEPYPPDARWAEPDVAAASALMREVVADPGGARRRGERASDELRRSHAPDVAGSTVEKRLQRIRDTRGHSTAPAQGDPATPDVVEVALDAARERLLRGPVPPPRSPAGPLGRAARLAVLRLMQPYTAHQRQVDEQLLAVARAEAHERRGEALLTHARTLRELRAVRAGLDKVSALAEDTAARSQRLLDETRAVPYMDHSPFSLRTVPGAGVVFGYEDGDGLGQGAGDDGYRAFEDVFRGAEALIRTRQERFLSFVEDRAPVLDVGCGRGEFLDLLATRGLAASGVDLDPGMVAHCRAKGHDVVHGDGLEHLASLEDGSLGMVFAAQVVEHLPVERLKRLLALTHVKLRPGGRLCVETVNPHSVQALKTFWADPTHEHPLFPEPLLALVRAAGFDEAFAFHPNGTGDYDRDRFETGEYAVVAAKGAQPGYAEGSGSATSAGPGTVASRGRPVA